MCFKIVSFIISLFLLYSYEVRLVAQDNQWNEGFFILKNEENAFGLDFTWHASGFYAVGVQKDSAKKSKGFLIKVEDGVVKLRKEYSDRIAQRILKISEDFYVIIGVLNESSEIGGLFVEGLNDKGESLFVNQIPDSNNGHIKHVRIAGDFVYLAWGNGREGRVVKINAKGQVHQTSVKTNSNIVAMCIVKNFLYCLCSDEVNKLRMLILDCRVDGVQIKQIQIQDKFQIKSMTIDEAGSFFIAGGLVLQDDSEYKDNQIIIVKLSDQYELMWKKIYGGSRSEEVIDIFLREKKVLVTGMTSSHAEFGRRIGVRDAFVLQLTEFGESITINRYGTKGADMIFKSGLHHEGYIYFIGSTKGVLPWEQGAPSNKFNFLMLKVP